MSDSKRFMGLQYPLVKTPHGVLARKNEVEQIKADIIQLLLTNPGERVMMPDFGTPLRTLIFEPNDPALETTAQKMISDSITKWEPRVVITAINVTSTPDAADLNPQDTGDEIGSILLIQINFVDPGDIQNIESLELEVPIGA